MKAKTFEFKLLFAVLEFLHRYGLSKEELEALVEDALKELRSLPSPKISSPFQQPTIATSVSGAFHRWHRDRTLLDPNGKPRPLKLYGRAPSVESLIRRENPSKPARQVANEVKKLNLVRATASGLYIPTGMHTVISHQHPYVSEHLAHSVVRLLNTAQRNASAKTPAATLIERYAHVPELKPNQLRAFRDFTRQQGEALIDTMNDWLEAHRSTRTPGRTARPLQAGLHVFAYVGSADKQKLK